MEEWVAAKLLELGYDPQSGRAGGHQDVWGISNGAPAAFLFGGRVITRTSNITTVLQDDNLLVSNARYGDLVSLYISPLAKRFYDEGINMKEIPANDKRYLQDVVLNKFCLVVDDARKNNVATFEFWTKGEMLYVPKRS